jgi:hypothetical protein
MNFDKLVSRILKEQEGLDPDLNPLEKTSLPQESDLTYIELMKFAVSALFTELDDLLDNRLDLRSEIKKLHSLKPVNDQNAPEALSICKNLISAAGTPVNEIPNLENLDFATKGVIINLIINALFSSKKELENSDPSISSSIEQIAADFRQLKNIQQSDPESSLSIADSIKDNISNVLTTTNLQIEQ